MRLVIRTGRSAKILAARPAGNAVMANGQNFSRLFDTYTTPGGSMSSSSSSLPLRKYDGKIERWGMEYPFPKARKNKGRVWEEERKLTFLYDIFAAFMEADFETRIYSSDNNSKKHLGHTCRLPRAFSSKRCVNFT